MRRFKLARSTSARRSARASLEDGFGDFSLGGRLFMRNPAALRYRDGGLRPHPASLAFRLAPRQALWQCPAACKSGHLARRFRRRACFFRGQLLVPRAHPGCRSSVVEHSLGKGEVESSIPSGSTIKIRLVHSDFAQLAPIALGWFASRSSVAWLRWTGTHSPSGQLPQPEGPSTQTNSSGCKSGDNVGRRSRQDHFVQDRATRAALEKHRRQILWAGLLRA